MCLILTSGTMYVCLCIYVCVCAIRMCVYVRMYVCNIYMCVICMCHVCVMCACVTCMCHVCMFVLCIVLCMYYVLHMYHFHGSYVTNNLRVFCGETKGGPCISVTNFCSLWYYLGCGFCICISNLLVYFLVPYGLVRFALFCLVIIVRLERQRGGVTC